MRRFNSVIRPVVLGCGIGLFMSLAFFVGIFETSSARITDRLFLPQSPDPSVVIVAIDDASILQIGRWPWPRRVHADLIQVLTEAGAKVIAYDVNFPESSDPENDAALAASIRSAQNVVLPVELQLHMKGGVTTYDPEHRLASQADILSAARAVGHSNTPPDSDGVLRRIPLAPSSASADRSVVYSFAAEAMRVAGLSEQVERAALDPDQRLVVHFSGPPFRTFPTLSAVDVLRHRVSLERLRGATVFVGSTAADLHDVLLVPTSHGLLMPGVEIHASAYDTLASGRFLRHVPRLLAVPFLILCALLVTLLVMRSSIRVSLLVSFVLWIGACLGVFFLFDQGWIADLLWPTLTIIFTYAAVTIERRITADRERRELKIAFSRYVSPAVVDALIQDPKRLRLGGERRRMSVLFSDIRGFTTISEGLDPEGLVQMLNIYLHQMTEIVFTHQGVLDKYIGDAVMAFWNAPLDQLNHARDAVETAIEMRDTLVRMNQDKAFGERELHIGLGINTGDMVVGNVGGEARFDYTVIGDNVNLASRLEGLTKEYGVGIIITEETRKDCSKDILTRRLDKVAVKGKKEPVMIYEAMCRMVEAPEDLRDLATQYERALEFYFARDFVAARDLCEKILETHHMDDPTTVLRNRAIHFIESPPPATWDGTWVYTKK